MHNPHHERNEEAYRRLEDSIRAGFPHGHFVAIDDGAIVGNASDFMALYRAHKSAGRDPRQALIVQAGHFYPKEFAIFRAK